MANKYSDESSSSYLILSESAGIALREMCRTSGLENPVIRFYGASPSLTGDDSFKTLFASGASEKDLHDAAREIAKESVANLEFKLIVECVPRDQIPKEFIVLIDGIAINAPAPQGWSGPKVLLDWRGHDFFLIGEDGTNLFDLSISILKGNNA